MTEPAWLALKPDPYFPESGFQRFNQDGCDGLAWIRELRIDVLAICSQREGRGNFRNFINACKAHHHTVCFWHEINPDLGAILVHYGFEPAMEWLLGEKTPGYRWDR